MMCIYIYIYIHITAYKYIYNHINIYRISDLKHLSYIYISLVVPGLPAPSNSRPGLNLLDLRLRHALHELMFTHHSQVQAQEVLVAGLRRHKIR